MPLSFKTPFQDDPESNHTSMVSVPLRKLDAFDLCSDGSNSSMSFINHASVPSLRTMSVTCLMILSSINTSFVSSKKKHGIGTPQERWREMHQSERPETMGRMRFEPDSGMNFTESNAFNASSLKPSTEQNHCSVARKIVGFFVRQSYGYLCLYGSRFNKAFAACNCSMHFSFPSPRTFKPNNSDPASSVKLPKSSTGECNGKLYFKPAM